MSGRGSLRGLALFGALVAIWVFFAIASESFLSPRNLSLLAIELSVTASLALGMLLVLLPAQIDLSAGSGVGLIGGVASVLVFHHGWPSSLAMLTGAALAVVVWSLMGTLIVRQRVPAFIITLGGLLAFKGFFWLVIGNATVPVSRGAAMNAYAALTTFYLSPALSAIVVAVVVLGAIVGTLRVRARRLRHGFDVDDPEITFLKLFITAQALALVAIVSSQFRGIPLSLVVLAALAGAVTVFTSHTRYGRYLYAIGDNEEAAFLSGIPVGRVVVTAFAAMGAVVAITGFMQTAYAGASTTTVGELMELDAIAACVIGGTSLRGGRGTVLGVLFGALIMTSLLNGMTLLAVSPELKLIVRGSVLVLAVWMDVTLTRRGS